MLEKQQANWQNDVILPLCHCLNALHSTYFQADLQWFLYQTCAVRCRSPAALRSYSAVTHKMSSFYQESNDLP